MKNLIVVLLFLFSINIYAQDDDVFNPYFQFAEESKYLLLADDVNARTKPDLKSDIVAKLPIATEITVLEKSEKYSVINGITAPWYKISFKENSKVKNAYIWGGFISFTAENHVNEDGVVFLCGISKIEKSEGDLKIVMQLRAAKGNKQLKKIEFNSFGSTTSSRDMTLSKSKGVSGIKNILRIGYSDNYCGGAFGDQIYFWDGKKFIFVRNLQSGADAPCYSIEEFIYPQDEGGKKDLIILKFEAGCSEGEDEEDEITRKMTEFSWKNNKLVYLKEYEPKKP